METPVPHGQCCVNQTQGRGKPLPIRGHHADTAVLGVLGRREEMSLSLYLQGKT